MKTFIFLPPVKKPAGGVAVLRQLADALHASGRETFLVARDQSGWRPTASPDAAPVMEWNDAKPTSSDVWLVPEGWVNALAPGLDAGSACLSYVQNWAYMFSSLPESVDWTALPVEFLAVSQPVSLFVKEATYRDAPVIRPAIDRSIFNRGDTERGDRITVAFMPRKNKGIVEQVRRIVEHRVGRDQLRWMPIDGLDAHGVAAALQSAHIFFMSGYPEGCPLPPLEAMACGCLPVGFTGFGGWDYMRQAQDFPRCAPWFPLRETAWSGNGFWCADGDVLDAALCLEEAATLLRDGDPLVEQTLAAGQLTADAYSAQAQRQEILDVWGNL